MTGSQYRIIKKKKPYSKRESGQINVLEVRGNAQEVEGRDIEFWVFWGDDGEGRSAG